MRRLMWASAFAAALLMAGAVDAADNPWVEYMKTGKTAIPNAVKKEAPKDFVIRKGQMVPVKKSNEQAKALKMVKK